VTHHVSKFTPAEMRAYAHGLRSSTGIAWLPEESPLRERYDPILQASAMLLNTVSAACMREADLVEGFAARLESAALPTPSNQPAERDQPRPLTPERVAAWAARFEAAALRTAAHPATAAPVCTAADAQCVAGCSMPQDGQCGRDAPDLSRPPLADRWYRFAAMQARYATLADALSRQPIRAVIPVESSEWEGTRYAFRAPNDEGGHDVILSETLAEAHAYLADLPGLAPEEATQEGLADAVAESQATPPTIGRTPAIWTEERDALLAHLYPTLICPDALFGLLNALPGEPIAGPKAMRQRAAGRGIARQGLPLPEGYEDQPIAGRSPKGMAGTVQAAAAAESEAQRHSTKALPDDVKARARAMFIAGKPMPEIGQELGVPKTTINTWAGKYGWREERDAAKGRPASMPGPKPEPIAAVTEAMTTEDKAEARERLRTGQSKGAKDLIEWFGCTADEAQALVDEWRAKQKGRPA
jgi:transposase